MTSLKIHIIEFILYIDFCELRQHTLNAKFDLTLIESSQSNICYFRLQLTGISPSFTYAWTYNNILFYFFHFAESVKALLGRHTKILVKYMIKLETKGDKTENRVLVFTPVRVYLLTAKVPTRVNIIGFIYILLFELFITPNLIYTY